MRAATRSSVWMAIAISAEARTATDGSKRFCEGGALTAPFSFLRFCSAAHSIVVPAKERHPGESRAPLDRNNLGGAVHVERIQWIPAFRRDDDRVDATCLTQSICHMPLQTNLAK